MCVLCCVFVPLRFVSNMHVFCGQSKSSSSGSSSSEEEIDDAVSEQPYGAAKAKVSPLQQKCGKLALLPRNVFDIPARGRLRLKPKCNKSSKSSDRSNSSSNSIKGRSKCNSNGKSSSCNSNSGLLQQQ